MNSPVHLRFELADERNACSASRRFGTIGKRRSFGAIVWRAGSTNFPPWTAPTKVGSLGLCQSGRLAVALTERIALLDRRTGQFFDLISVPLPADFLRLNDGKLGPDGAFWVGSMDDRTEKQPAAALYRITRDGVELRHEGLIVSNGPAWSMDGGTMYYSDSRACWIEACDFDPSSGKQWRWRRIATPRRRPWPAGRRGGRLSGQLFELRSLVRVDHRILTGG